MARYAILTSIHYTDGHIPEVLLESEDAKTVVTYRGGEEVMSEPLGGKVDVFELNLFGNSYQNVERGEYSGTAKERVDLIIKTGRLPKAEEDAIIAEHKQWWGPKSDGAKS